MNHGQQHKENQVLTQTILFKLFRADHILNAINLNRAADHQTKRDQLLGFEMIKGKLLAP